MMPAINAELAKEFERREVYAGCWQREYYFHKLHAIYMLHNTFILRRVKNT